MKTDDDCYLSIPGLIRKLTELEGQPSIWLGKYVTV